MLAEKHALSEQQDTDDVIAYAWKVGPSSTSEKRSPEDADNSVAYA